MTAREVGDRGQAPRPEELCRALLERVAEYAILAVDRQGVVMSWSAGAERMTGYRADEARG